MIARTATAGVVAAILLGAPSAALGHAQLEQTVPARGATVRTQPPLVVFGYDEAVEGNFGAVRVFDAKGTRVDDDRVVHPGGDGRRLAVGLRPRLPAGTYTATYRVISADGHPVSGGLIFSIGRPGAGPSQTVDELIGSSGAGRLTSIGFGLVKGLQYLATALAVGVLGFLAWCWGPSLAGAAGADARWREAADAFAARATRALGIAVVLGLVASGLGLVFEAATGGGTSFWAALAPTPVHEALGTRFGTFWGGRMIVWAALGVVVLAAVPRRALALRPVTLGATGYAPPRLLPAQAALPAGLAALLVLAPALAGHAATQSPVALLVALDVAHVTAMSLWLGGLVSLVAMVGAATRRLEPADRTRLLAAVLLRFSPIALAAVLTLTATGLVQAYVHVRHLDAITSTPFGRAVLIKTVLLVGLVGLGWVNRQRVLPGLRAAAADGAAPGGAGRLLRRTLRLEVGLVVVVLGVTSALVGYVPPVSRAAGPFSVDKVIGASRLTATVDPARAGVNELHVYLFDRRTGAPTDRTRQLTVSASLPAKRIGPLPVTMRKAGPGHYVADTFVLSPGGTWTLSVTNRVSDFDQDEVEVEVRVR